MTPNTIRATKRSLWVLVKFRTLEKSQFLLLLILSI